MSDDVVKRFRDAQARPPASTPAPTDAKSASTTSPVPQTRALIRNHLELKPLFKIVLTNFVLTVLTLGIYRFWAKARLRQYLWGHAEIMGDRLEYTGTGKELFLGFLFIFAVILVPMLAFFAFLDTAMVDAPDLSKVMRDTLQTVLVIFLIGVAFYRARRYRLTRTHWRGIYGNQTGSAFMYGMLALGSYLATSTTLGLMWPMCSIWLKTYEMEHTWVGNQQPTFKPKASKLYGPFMIAWVGSIALVIAAFFLIGVGAAAFGLDFEGSSEAGVGVVLAAAALIYCSIIPVFALFMWYRGKAYNHFVSSTRFLGHDITSAITGAGFAWLTVGNAVLMLLSLGLAAPFVYRRYLNYVERTVGLSGDGNFSDLLQGEIGKPGTGEGLADAFDVGAI